MPTHYGLLLNKCWCGDEDYDVFGESTACDDPCDGDASQICGGHDALSISVIEEVSIIGKTEAKDELCTVTREVRGTT